MEGRLNLGNEVRDLKLGASFKTPNSRDTVKFHTLKYDFKPASVDINKAAKLDVSSNNQVTVTVPHLDGSGVPNTVFKGNQRDYTKKECVLIINRETGEIVLERLHNNIQVKKTRHETSVKTNNPPLTMAKNHLENHTTRFSSKTKVSTGNRNNRNTINYVPKHSPIQNSPSYPHKSPQGATAPAWNANNTQQTLPSIPIIGLDDTHDNFTTGITPSHQPITSTTSNVLTIQNQYNPIVHNLIQPNYSNQHSGSVVHNNNNISDSNELGYLSSSESSSSESSGTGSESDSDDEHNENSTANNIPGHQQPANCTQETHFLSEDLRLSESNSDSD